MGLKKRIEELKSWLRINGLTDPNQNSGVLRHPFFDVCTVPWRPIMAAHHELSLFFHQPLVEMAGTDGKAEEGGVALEMFAMEADLLTVTCRLEKPMRKKPPFLRWVGNGPSREWTQY